MDTSDETLQTSPDGSTVVVAWNNLIGPLLSHHKQAALRRSLAGRKVIVMGKPPGDQLRTLMQTLLQDGAVMATGVDDAGDTYVARPGGTTTIPGN